MYCQTSFNSVVFHSRPKFFRRSMSDNDDFRVTKWFHEELLAKEVVSSDGVACALDVAVGKGA
jgi:hypothetical protein